MELCKYSYFAPKFLVSIQPKLQNQLFRFLAKQPKLASLFWIVSKLVSVLVSVLLIRVSFVGHPSLRICVITVVLHTKLIVSVQLKL